MMYILILLLSFLLCSCDNAEPTQEYDFSFMGIPITDNVDEFTKGLSTIGFEKAKPIPGLEYTGSNPYYDGTFVGENVKTLLRYEKQTFVGIDVIFTPSLKLNLGSDIIDIGQMYLGLYDKLRTGLYDKYNNDKWIIETFNDIPIELTDRDVINKINEGEVFRCRIFPNIDQPHNIRPYIVLQINYNGVTIGYYNPVLLNKAFNNTIKDL